MKSKKSPYPKWVNEHRKPGTEIRKIGDKFYIYSVSAYYDAARGKGRKKTGPYLGRITQQDGFIDSVMVQVSHLGFRDTPLRWALPEDCRFTVGDL